MGLPPPSNRESISAIANAIGLRGWLERLYPLAGGVACALVMAKAGVSKPQFDSLVKDVVPVAVSVAAIFAGFQGAVHAILLSMLRSRVVRAMRKEDMYGRLIGFIRSGFGTLTLFVAASIFVLVSISLNKFPDYAAKWTAAGLLGLFVWALLASVRVTLVEVRMLHNPDE